MIPSISDIKSHHIGPLLYIRKEQRYEREKMHWNDWLETKAMYTFPLTLLDESSHYRKRLHEKRKRQGESEHSAASADEIADFIQFYNIDMTQFEDQEYLSMNDFFTRKIRLQYRPVDIDPNTVVSPADCRLMVFDNVVEAKDLYIKGHRFTLDRLLNHDQLAAKVSEGSMLCARLFLNDLHHFAAPVAGTITQKYRIGGTDYDTEKSSIESRIDVLGENEREVIQIEGDQGTCVFVAIGASSVGKVNTDGVHEGMHVDKGQFIGFFEYGGSAIVVLFDKQIQWDADLVRETQQGIETLLNVRERIGQFTENSGNGN